jgi:hypothetical protein
MKKLFILALLWLVPGLNFAQTPEEIRFNAHNFSISADDLKPAQPAASFIPVSAEDTNRFSVFEHLASLNLADSEEINISRSGDVIIIEKSQNGKNKDAYSDAFPRGDVVFLIGHLEDSWTKNEWTRYYGVAKWLVKNGFRVVMNPVATLSGIKAAVQDGKTKVIIWSSHANREGYIYDSADTLVPTNIFAENAGPNFKQIIVSSCYSNLMVKNYQFPTNLKKIYWEGTTNSDVLFDYLYKRWDPRTLD